MQKLAGKTIFVTGATSGFGKAFAEKFIAEGAKVIASGRREERLQELQKQLGDNLHIITLDVRDKNQIANAIKNLPEKFSEIDILINNAGLALGLEKPPYSSFADWEQMIDTNIKGACACVYELLPQMTQRNNGHIVNIGSVAGKYPYPGGNVYGATKAFIRQFSLNLRADLLGKNIRVTNIEPGMVETEFSVVRFHGDENKAKDIYQGMQPLSAQDIAESVLFAITCPAHVNINSIELMPTMQAFSPFAVHRE